MKDCGIPMVRNTVGERTLFSLDRFVRDAVVRGDDLGAARVAGRQLLADLRDAGADVVTTDAIRHKNPHRASRARVLTGRSLKCQDSGVTYRPVGMNMARHGKSVSTKTALLDAAMGLMLAKGYTATSIDEICQSAGVTKGSFFHYFKDKQDLGKAVLDHNWNVTHERALADPSATREEDPLQRLYSYVDQFIAISNNPEILKSCLYGNLAQELFQTHPRITERCGRGFSQWADEIKQDLDAARARHAPETGIDTASLAEHFIAVYEGALILTKAGQDPGKLAEHMRHFKRYIQFLFERGEHEGGGGKDGKVRQHPTSRPSSHFGN